MPTILIYDPGEEGRKGIHETLRIRKEWKLVEAASSHEAIDTLDSEPVDLIVIGTVSLRLHDDPLIQSLRSRHPSVPVVILTGSEGGAVASVDTLLLGTASYVPRSVIARDLVVTVERILTLAGCRRRHARLLDALEATESRFTLSNNDLELIPVLVGHLAEMCDEFSVCGTDGRMRMAVALEEAITNGIVHGNLEVPSSLRDEGEGHYDRLIRTRRNQCPYRDRTLSVLGEFIEGAARFIIRDEGPGFDPSGIPDPTEFANLGKSHGRGLYLIKAFMDEVSFNELGNEIRLVKRALGQTRAASNGPKK